MMGRVFISKSTSIKLFLFFFFFSLPVKGVLYGSFEVLFAVFLLLNFKETIGAERSIVHLFRTSVPWQILILLGLCVHYFNSDISANDLYGTLIFLLRAYLVCGLVILYFRLMPETNRYKTLLLVCCAAMFLHSLSMFNQWFTGWDLTFRIYKIVPYERLSGSVFNPNPFGLFMALGIFASLEVLRVSDDYWQLIAALLIFSFSICLVMSGSRGAFVSIVLSLVYFWFLAGERIKWVIFTLLGVFIGSALYFYRFNREFIDDSRIRGIAESFLYIVDNPLFGATESSMNRSNIFEGISGPHNILLDFAIRFGLPTLSVFLYWIYSCLKNKGMASREHSLSFCTFFLIFIAGMFDYSISDSKIYSGIFFFFFAYAYMSKSHDGNPPIFNRS